MQTLNLSDVGYRTRYPHISRVGRYLYVQTITQKENLGHR